VIVAQEGTGATPSMKAFSYTTWYPHILVPSVQSVLGNVCMCFLLGARGAGSQKKLITPPSHGKKIQFICLHEAARSLWIRVIQVVRNLEEVTELQTKKLWEPNSCDKTNLCTIMSLWLLQPDYIAEDSGRQTSELPVKFCEPCLAPEDDGKGEFSHHQDSAGCKKNIE